MGATDRGLSGWQAVSELLDAGLPLTDAAEADARGLLALSSRNLAPLEDPLSIDFRRHRWLRFNREEAYSDWFAWILDELRSVRMVCEILGINVPAGTGDDGAFVVEREVPISHGQADHEGRLDILLTRTGACLAIVEIKVTSADVAVIDKHDGYIRWHEDQENFPCKPRVIISNSGSKTVYKGFHHRGWHEVCTTLRQLVPALIADGHCLLSALILCFCGAVEEKLLGLETITGRIGRPASRAGCIETSKYLARTMKLTVRRDSNPDSIRKQERFMETGLRCYPQAMFALRDFRSMVLESAKTVLEGKLDALGTAIGSPLNPSSVEDHINPNDLGQSDGRWAWIAKKIELPVIGRGHFGLLWGGPMSTDPTDCRAAAMILPLLARREEILAAAQSINAPVERWRNEILLTAELSSTESVFDSAGGPSVFERELAQLIDRWCRILSALILSRS